MSSLQRCVALTGKKVHLTPDPVWKWYPEELRSYPTGRTYCRVRVARVLWPYESIGEADETIPADTRPVDCKHCRAVFLRGVFADLIWAEGRYSDGLVALLSFEVRYFSSKGIEEVLHIDYGNDSNPVPALALE